jgi:hypothetical protein
LSASKFVDKKFKLSPVEMLQNTEMPTFESARVPDT